MKIILNLLSAATLIALTFVTNSCNDALNLVEPGKEIPVIYGFLSLNDTATYIRVERAFVDTKKGAAEIAQIPDSLYYPISTTVTLIRAKDNTKFVLDRVDGNLEGYKRAAGIFATSPNYLYKIKNTRLAMKADEEWRVEVEKAGETKPIATGVTRVIGNYEIIGPTTARALFVTTENAFPVTFETTTDVTAKFYAVNVVFNYADSTAAQVTPQSVTWQFTTSEARKGVNVGFDQQTISRNGRDFYEFIGSNIPVNANVARKFRSITIEVTAGGQELNDLLTNGIANLGITGSQTIPIYTNITNGLGVFASRNKFIKTGIMLNDQALEILKTGDITKKLNFR